jgi:hypothetical protein
MTGVVAQRILQFEPNFGNQAKKRHIRCPIEWAPAGSVTVESGYSSRNAVAGSMRVAFAAGASEAAKAAMASINGISTKVIESTGVTP